MDQVFETRLRPSTYWDHRFEHHLDHVNLSQLEVCTDLSSKLYCVSEQNLEKSSIRGGQD